MHKTFYFPFSLWKQPVPLQGSLHDRASAVSIVMNPTKEDDTVVLGDDAYFNCLLVDGLDHGDIRTVSELLEEESEQDDEMQSEDDALPVTTRSGRRSARDRNSSYFVFY